VAFDLLELATGPGLERVDDAGGLRAFSGWDGPALGIARVAAPGAGARSSSGWRAHRLPELVSGQAGVLRLLSGVDGREVTITVEELAAWAERQGVLASAQLSPRGPVFALWLEPAAAAPPGELVVSALAPELARAGRYWDGAGWADLEAAAGDGPLLEGCPCRACAIATRPLLRHLRQAREITGEHLLTWHNTHWTRVIAEEREAAPWRER